jgi:hypothetical protein
MESGVFWGIQVILKELEPQKMANCAMSCAKQLGLVAEEVAFRGGKRWDLGPLGGLKHEKW